MLKISQFEYWIICLLFLLIPLDIVNGILLHNNIVLPISVSQIFKVFIMALLLLRISLNTNKFLFVCFLFILLILPSAYQIVKQGSYSFVLADIIKSTRYLLPVVSFLFFTEVFKKKMVLNHKTTYTLLRFSYGILIMNIFTKFIGLGYPMYEHGDIGSRGFFHAGNELSVLLIILSSVMAYNMWVQKRKKTFYLFFVLNILVGITLSSKTGILGILLVFFLIPIKLPSRSLSLRKFRMAILTLLLVLPTVLFLAWQIIKSSSLYLRFAFFWEKLDVVTFLLSSRNTFASSAYEIYKSNYSTLEKIIGVGQSKFESLNGNKIIEIDVLDIFFAYGYLGVTTFLLFILFLIFQSWRFKRKPTNYPYASFVFLMVFILLGISTVAGHVFNSGLAGVFLGILFALMFKQYNDNEESITAL